MQTTKFVFVKSLRQKPEASAVGTGRFIDSRNSTAERAIPVSVPKVQKQGHGEVIKPLITSLR